MQEKFTEKEHIICYLLFATTKEFPIYLSKEKLLKSNREEKRKNEGKKCHRLSF